MPVRMLNFVKEPPPYKKGRRASAVEQLPEFQDAVLALGAGLQVQEYLEIEISPESVARLGGKTSPQERLRMVLAERVKKLKLPYDVYVSDHKVYVVGRGPLS